MVKVMVFGTYDILHPGHLHFLRQAKNLGDSLFVLVSRDSTVKRLKGKSAVHSEKERLNKILSLPYVNYAILGSPKNRYAIIEKIMPDVICLGYDQSHFTRNLAQELKKRNIHAKIIRLKAYKEHIYKSSKLRIISHLALSSFS